MGTGNSAQSRRVRGQLLGDVGRNVRRVVALRKTGRGSALLAGAISALSRCARPDRCWPMFGWMFSVWSRCAWSGIASAALGGKVVNWVFDFDLAAVGSAVLSAFEVLCGLFFSFKPLRTSRINFCPNPRQFIVQLTRQRGLVARVQQAYFYEAVGFRGR